MNIAIKTAFDDLINSLSPEAWDELPQYVQENVEEAHKAISAYDADIRATLNEWEKRVAEL
jgi:hypothetical protein